MSLSNGFKEDNRNPSQFWLRFHNGAFEYYDKEKKTNVVIKNEDFTFFLLDDQLMKVSGFIEPKSANVISNEVRSVSDELVVSLYFKGGRKEVILKGPYSEIKDKLPQGAKYAISCYVAIQENILVEGGSEELVIANVEIRGGSLEGWIEFKNKIRSKSEFGVYQVKIENTYQKKRGSVVYEVPVFAFGRKKTQSEVKASLHLDEDLQAYLKDYLDGDPVKRDSDLQRVAGEEVQEFPDDDVPAENLEDDTSFLDFKLKNGKALKEFSVEELEEVYEKGKASNVPEDSLPMVSVRKSIQFKKNQSKNKNPFGTESEIVSDEDDDIPF